MAGHASSAGNLALSRLHSSRHERASWEHMAASLTASALTWLRPQRVSQNSARQAMRGARPAAFQRYTEDTPTPSARAMRAGAGRPRSVMSNSHSGRSRGIFSTEYSANPLPALAFSL